MDNKKIRFIINKRVKRQWEFIPQEIFIRNKTEFIKKNPKFGLITMEEVIEPNIKKFIKVFDKDKTLQKILLFGEVQSGKTNNMIFLTSVLRDIGFNKFILFTGTKNNLNEQNIKRFKEYNNDCSFLDFKNENNFFSDTDQTVFLYGLKQNISNLVNNFSDLSPINYKDWKVAIIDDESDEASAEKNKLGRTINYNIEQLLILKMKNLLYIPVTATPYANLLSYTDFLTPNYLIPLESSKSYTGLKVFNKSDCYKLLDNDIYQNLINLNVNDNVFNAFFEDLLIYFYSCCKKYNENLQFLINTTSEVKKINNLILFMNRIILQLKIKEPIFYKSKNIINIEDFKSFLRSIKLKMTIENHKYVREDAPEIIIGGNLLSRGITFEKLIIEIMTNHGKPSSINSDTLLQRARWFGYRLKYLEDIRIYLSSTAKVFYNNIEYLEYKIRDMYNINYEHNMSKKERIESLFKDKLLKWTS